MIRWTLLAIAILAIVCCVLTMTHRVSRGLAFPSWPIGPITITAAMTAAWSVIGFVQGIYQIQQSRGPLRGLIFLASGLLGLIVLVQTGRRSALAAWLVALFVISCLHLVCGWNRRQIVVALTVAISLAIGSGAIFLAHQAASPTPEASGPVALRFTYWQNSVGLIKDHPLFGYGPDTFVIHMTNKVAALRAESPDLFRSNIDPHCHNEWLQAGVELGLFGGIIYLGLPIGFLVILTRRILLFKDKSSLAEPMACAAGLATIMVTDAASITLRGPIMPVLYWTLLGLAGACAESPRESAVEIRRKPILKAGVFALAALGFLFASAVDIFGSVEEVLRPQGRTLVRSRLFAEKYLSARIKTAGLVLATAKTNPLEAAVDHALTSWQAIYDSLPGYGPVHSALAECLLLARRPEKALVVLRAAISERTNPYDPQANELLAELSEGQPIEQYHCAQRSLRGGAIGIRMEGIAKKALAVPVVNAEFAVDVQRAREIATNPEENTVRDEMADTLRLSALPDNNRNAAIPDQRRAADLYRDLEKKRSRYRRVSEAEVDAFLQLARLLYEANSFQESLDAIKEAERYAVLGIAHETLADPQPQYGYVIGEVMPTEFPENLRPLWRFSALLHLIVGDDRFLDYRIWFSLPPQRWTQQDLNAEMAALAGEAHQTLSRLPNDKRPGHYDRLLEMSRRQ